jgi:stalled ribosome rescue protein Dom34
MTAEAITADHVAIWIDHKEARIFAIDAEHRDANKAQVLLHHIHNKHPRGAEGVKEHPDDAKRFFHEVAHGVANAKEVLVVGPSNAKLEFVNFAHKHEPALVPKIVAVETVAHPTNAQIVAYAKEYFGLSDRKQPT